MVMARELSAILDLQICTTLVFVGRLAGGLTNEPYGPAVRLYVARIAAFANAERLQYLPINLSLQQCPDHSARNPDLGGLVPLDSYLSVGSGAGTVERSLLMAKSRVRFSSETTPGTVR
jgi:hypothetical protein